MKHLHNQLSDLFKLFDQLSEDSSLECVEKSIITEATRLFKGDFAGIKYIQGQEIINATSTVPQEMTMKPRKGGYTYRSVTKKKAYVMTEDILRKAHPESSPAIKSILLIPLNLGNGKAASMAVFCTHDNKKNPNIIHSLEEFGEVTGRLLASAHILEAKQKALHNRDAFLSYAAHELKTPLTALNSYTQILDRILTQRGVASDQEFIKKIKGEVDRVTHLIQELLVDQVQFGQLQYRKKQLVLSQLLRKVAENFTIRLANRELHTNLETMFVDDIIVGDENKLSQVFINLLNNAAKFSEPSTPVVFSLHVSKTFLEIRVTDYGIGISSEEIPYIFNEFYRGTNTKNKKGMGVGLFLVKSIIESHGGRVEIESEVGKGTTFCVYLPKYSV